MRVLRSGIPGEDERKARMAEAVRQVVTRRERAPRSPRLERALKRLIWRYTRDQEGQGQSAAGRAEEEKAEKASVPEPNGE